MSQEPSLVGIPKKLVRLLLKPALRVCLQSAVTFNDVVDAAKHEMISLAVSEMKKNGDKVTVSRLSIMTGINRKEINRIYKLGSEPDDHRNLITQVLGQWENDEHFCTAAGKPRVLSYKGEESDFYELVQTLSTDVNPATVLFELERVGAVERTATGVRMKNVRHELHVDPERAFDLLSRDSETIVRVVQENVYTKQETRNLHSRTEFDNISKDDLPTIRKWLLREGTRFHNRARAYMAKFDKDLNPERQGEGGNRVVLGSFSWTNK